MRRFLFLLLALVSLTPATAQPLNVAAAASLTEAMRDVAKAFEAARPGVGVQLQFGASGMLLQDIAGGKPADKIIHVAREFATNALVLIVPTDRSSPVQRLQDLARPEIRRIAMGRTATVPAGRYARQAIDALRLWPALQQKIVFGDSVRAVLQAVASGDVDAGFVYATDVPVAGERVRVVQTLAVQPPIRYPATVVAASDQQVLARDFIAFLNQPQARAVFSRYGFGAP